MHVATPHGAEDGCGVGRVVGSLVGRGTVGRGDGCGSVGIGEGRCVGGVGCLVG